MVEELKKRISALEDAGLDATEEKAKLAAMTPKASTRTTAKAPAKAPAKAVAAAEPEEEMFIPLNVETFRTGGGGWIIPETIGVKDAVCTGYLIPNFAEDQVWFTFENVPDATEIFRGSLVCGALSKDPGQGGAWKVKDVLTAINVLYEEDEERGGIRLLSDPKGKPCQVLWDDIVRNNKTERRIQDVMAVGAEAVM